MLTEAQRLQMLECPSRPVDAVLDTDAYNEIDDQYAISYALAAGERIRLKALYAAPFENSLAADPAEGMEKSYREINHLLGLMGRSAPVLRGSPSFLPDEKTPVDSPAARDLAERAMGYTWQEPLYVIGIAAITNIASALLLNPVIAERIVVVWLGGNAPEWPDSREFNLKQDVSAARVVFSSGAPLVILPCKGVVHAFSTTGPELEHWLRGRNALCDYLIDHTEETADRYASDRVWSRPIWDVTAVATMRS